MSVPPGESSQRSHSDQYAPLRPNQRSRDAPTAAGTSVGDSRRRTSHASSGSTWRTQSTPTCVSLEPFAGTGRICHRAGVCAGVVSPAAADYAGGLGGGVGHGHIIALGYDKSRRDTSAAIQEVVPGDLPPGEGTEVEARWACVGGFRRDPPLPLRLSQGRRVR